MKHLSVTSVTPTSFVQCYTLEKTHLLPQVLTN